MRPDQTFADAMTQREPEVRSGTIVSPVRGGRARVQMSSGQVIPGVRVVGGAAQGERVRVTHEQGEYTAQGTSGASAGTDSGGAGVSGVAGTGMITHDLLGSYHTLPSVTANFVFAAPSGATGTPSFRLLTLADIQSAADTRYALNTRTITAGTGLTGGGALTADLTLNVGAGTGITVNADDVAVNQGFAFAWTAQHTFTTPARAIGASGGWQYDDRTTAGAANRWTLYANSNISRWMYNATDQMWLTSTGILRSPGYVSQTTGAAVDYGTGAADFRYLYTDELHAKAFIADLEQALAGGQIISKSVTILFSAFTAPAAGASTTMTVRDLPSATGMRVFENGDFIRVRNFSRSGGSLSIGDCWGTVTLDTTYGTSGFDSATKTQRYTFTRSSGADAGAMASGTVVAADAIILDYGTAGNGIHEVNAIDGLYAINSPYSRIATWSTHPRTMTERTRTGNLRGITGATEYGFYAGDGGVADTNKFLRISTSEVRFNNVDFDIWRAGVRRFRVDASVPYIGLGSPNPTTYLGATGFWVGDNGSGTYQMHVGSTSAGVLTEGMSWSGSSLSIKVASQNVIMGSSGLAILQPEVASPASLNSYQFYSDTHDADQVGVYSWYNTAGSGTSFVRLANTPLLTAPAGPIATTQIRAEGASGSTVVISVGILGTALTDTTFSTDGITSAGSNFYLGPDTRLYRSAADMLRTPDGFSVDAGFNIGTATGARAGQARASSAGGHDFSAYIATSTTPSYAWQETDAGADQKWWDMFANSLLFVGRAMNDAGISGTNWLEVTRGTGTAITSVVFPNGRVGMGVSSPQAELHTYDTDGGTLHNWRATGIGATRVTVVPNGTGDCVQACSVFGIAYDSAGTAWELRGSLKSGQAAGTEQTVQVAGDGVNNIHIKVRTDGQVEIVRTAGANTWSVCMSVWWR